MLHWWCEAYKIMLPMFGYLTILCPSFLLILSSVTAGPTTSYDTTRRLIGNFDRNTGKIFPAAANDTNILTGSSLLSPYQSGCKIVLRSYTVWPGPSVITATDTTICPSLATSEMPPRIDATSTLPQGFGVYENTTFATSCAHDDPSCYAKCTSMANSCWSSWSRWTSGNSYLTFTKSPTSISTMVITSRSYSYSTSVVQEGEALITFDYAMPIGRPITTTTSLQTMYSMDQIVTRWTESPPTCTPSAWLKCTKGPDCRACTVQGGTVEVLFWPSASRTGTNESHTSSTQSFSNGSIALHDTISQPIVTAMFGTHTLTSPSVYISFLTAYALNDCGQTVGRARPGALLPMDPKSLFTMRGGLDYFEMTSDGTETTFYESASMDYNDLIGPVPPSAYTNQPSCLAYGCHTIYPDYHPQLALPPQVRNMDPAWASCALDWRGSWDPPIALSRAESIVAPTDPAEATYTEPASPRSTISSPAAMTTPPVAISDHSQTSPSTMSNPSSSPTTSTNAGPLFTYWPWPESDEILSETTIIESQQSGEESARLPVTQITTIIQIDPRPSTRETVILDPTLTHGSPHESHIDNDESDKNTADPAASTVSRQAPHDGTGGQLQSDYDGPLHSSSRTFDPVISIAPHGGLAISDTTITAGGDAITISSAVYSALSGNSLLIISNAPAAASSAPSPTNAYEVLSEALSTATAQQPYSASDAISDTTIKPSFSLDDPAYTSSTSHTLPTRTEAVLTITLGSTTLTASHHPSSHGIIQLGDNSQVLNSQNPVLAIGSHTLSVAPEGDGIVVDGSTTATFLQHPTSATVPVSSSSSDLPSVQASGSSILSGPGSGHDNGDENETGEASLPPVTFASPASPSDKNTGGGGGGEVGSGNVDSGSDESGANLSPKGFGWWPWVGAVTLILLANG